MANLFERTKISVLAKQQRDKRDDRYAARVVSETATVVSPKTVMVGGTVYRASVPGAVAGEQVAVVNQGGGSALYTPANASIVGGVGGSGSTGSTGGAAMTQHDITGSYHAASGLTAGQVIKATSTTTFGWRTLAIGELGPGTAQYQVPVTGATPFALTYVALNSLNGDGLAFSGGQFVVDSSIARSAIQIAGSGALGGGGNLTADRAITLNTPGSLTATSANSSATNHTHAIDSSIARSAIQIAGSGALGGGGNLTADRAITLNTPGSLTVASANSSATNHTHAITSNSAPGASASILASSSSGQLTLPLFVATTNVTTPSLTSSAALAITSVSGDISLDASTDVISIGASNLLKSANYASQTTGWGISYAGGGDFRYLYADEIHAKSFIADLEQALAGGQIISKSVAVLAVDFTAPASGATATLRVKDLPSAANMAIFQSGDIVRLRTFNRSSGSLSFGNCWGVVTGYTDQTDGTQTWTFTRSTSTNAGSIAAGTVISADSIVLDYGTSGNGIYEVNAIDGTYAANSPYWQVVTWTTHPATGQTVNARGGKLTGVTGNANEFGLFAGTGMAVTDSYLIISTNSATQNNISSRWYNGGTQTVAIQSDGDIFAGSNLAAVATTSFAHFAVSQTYGSESLGAGDVVIGNKSSGHMFWDASAGTLNFRNGTTVQSYINTSGQLVAGGGNIVMDAAALSVASTVTMNSAGISLPVQTYSTEPSPVSSALATSDPKRIHQGNLELASYTVDFDPLVGKRTGATIRHVAPQVSDFLSGGFSYVGSYSQLLIETVGYSSSVAKSAYISMQAGNDNLVNRSQIDIVATDYVQLATNQVYVSNKLYVNGIVESGQAQVSGNLNRFTGRYGTSSAIGLASVSWGLGSALLFNAYQANNAVRLTASGACKYLGTQYTGNVTAPGMFYYDANSNRFEWWIGEAGLASGADITAWAQQLQLESDGTLTLFGNLKWSGGGFASTWSSLTYNTGWGSYGSPYKAASYCKIGDMVMVNGLVLRSSGTSTTIGTLPSGYRPTTNKVFDARANIDGTVQSIRLDIDTSGNIIAINLAGGSTVSFISLDNILFRTNS